MSLLHVNGRTHITPYVSNIETTKTLSDLQFCRYNRTPLKVASTKYEVAMSIFTIFMPKMCTCIKLFLRPPLTQRYFCQFYRNFNKLWIIRKKLDTRKWNTNLSYWIPRTQEKSLGWSSSRIWHHNSSRDRCVFKLLNVFALLYCMANDVYWYL